MQLTEPTIGGIRIVLIKPSISLATHIICLAFILLPLSGISTHSCVMWTTASGLVYPAAVKLSLYLSMPMACSQSSTVFTAEDASGLPGSNRVVVLGLIQEQKIHPCLRCAL